MVRYAAGQIMSKPPTTVDRQTDLETAARMMLGRRIGSVIVVDERGEITGIVTDSDFAAKRAHIPFSTSHCPRCSATGWARKVSNESTRPPDR